MNNVIPIGRKPEGPEEQPTKPVPDADELLQMQHLANEVERKEDDPEEFWEAVAQLCNFLAGWR